jgi:hypothetical protein
MTVTSGTRKSELGKQNVNVYAFLVNRSVRLKSYRVQRKKGANSSLPSVSIHS